MRIAVKGFSDERYLVVLSTLRNYGHEVVKVEGSTYPDDTQYLLIDSNSPDKGESLIVKSLRPYPFADATLKATLPGTRSLLDHNLSEFLIQQGRQEGLLSHMTTAEEMLLSDYGLSHPLFKKTSKDLDSNETDKIFLNSKIAQAFNDGIFIRPRLSKRLGHYWNPGMNSGIPYTLKSDVVHTLVYQVHDVAHHMIPDLVSDGEDSRLHKLVYCGTRMFSEIWSMFFADMLYVGAYASSHSNYDFDKRFIYPLYRRLKEDYSHKQILKGLWSFALGDYESFPKSPELDVFQLCYTPFIAADWDWTLFNWSNIASRKQVFRKWNHMIGGEERLSSNKLMSVTQAIRLMGLQKSDSSALIMEKIFDYWSTNLLQDVEPKLIDFILRRQNAISRYKLGQSLLFAEQNPPTTFPFKIEYLDDFLSSQEVSGFFNLYLCSLYEERKITKLEAYEWKLIYPMHKPYYLDYAYFHKSIEEANKEIVGS